MQLDDAQKQRLAAALKKRLQREVRLHCEVDESLIGGAIVRTGDFVIDGSLKARLDRLAVETESLTSLGIALQRNWNYVPSRHLKSAI